MGFFYDRNSFIRHEVFLKGKDKFILSKAHFFPLCILLRERGFKTKIKTHLEIDEKNAINCTTGSLVMDCPYYRHGFMKKLKKKEGSLCLLAMVRSEGTTWKVY